MHDMSVRRIHRSLKRFKFGKKPTFACVTLSVRDIMRLYSLPKELSEAGALLDAFVKCPEYSDMEYVNWKGALPSQPDDSISTLVCNVYEMELPSIKREWIQKNPAAFLLKIALLCQQASILPAMDNKHIKSWFEQIRSLERFHADILNEKYAGIYKDMRAFLYDAYAEIEVL